MFKAGELCLFYWVLLLLPVAGAFAQDTSAIRYRYITSPFTDTGSLAGYLQMDSLLQVTAVAVLPAPVLVLPSMDSLKAQWKSSFPSFRFQKPVVRTNGGYISYNWNYRTSVDTPFTEARLSQHLVTSHINIVVAESLPIRAMFFGRQSNSMFFKDFNDFRVEFDAAEYRRIKSRKWAQFLKGYTGKLNDPLLKPSMDMENIRMNRFDDWLKAPEVVNKLLQLKERLLSVNLLDSLKKDSLVSDATSFIAYYDQVKGRRDTLEKRYDSLQTVYTNIQKNIQRLHQLIDGNLSDAQVIKEIQLQLEKSGVKSGELQKLLKNVSSVRTLAVGRNLPSFSDLTLDNMAVKGLNAEYNRNNFYGAIAAGSVDSRTRDFYKGKKIPQYVLAARVGYGRKERNNIILTFFKGKKQLYFSTDAPEATGIYGFSVATQYALKHLKVNVEAAQSSSPILSGENAKSLTMQLKDRSSQAYSIRIKNVFPVIKTRLEAGYQYTGINFQSFTSYKVSADVIRWNARLEQDVWKRQVHMAASLQKNNFDNPVVLQRYNAQTVYKSFRLDFKKRSWPSVTLGYVPSSQYTMVGEQVFETHYQMLNATLSHQYKTGLATASSSLVYNRFFNDSRDSGFVFYNAGNFYFSQGFRFSFYTASIAVSHSGNGQYDTDVLELGLNANIFKQVFSGFGVKINRLNSEDVKVGYYTSANVNVPGIGDLSVRMEKSYLPGMQHQLIQNDFYQIGFTRYIK